MKEAGIRKILDECASSFYVFDTDAAREEIRRMRTALPGRTRICYSMKANPFLTGALAGEADFIEACSFGEFAICERLGVPPEKIVLSGVNKGREDLLRVLERYGGRVTYTAESMTQWKVLDEYAKESGEDIRVLPRLTNGSQFGMDREEIETILEEQAERKADADCLQAGGSVQCVTGTESSADGHSRAGRGRGARVIGIHFFAGTQKKNMQRDLGELRMLDGCLRRWKEEFGFEPERLEYGPGMAVDYYGTDQAQQEKEDRDLQALSEALDGMDFQGRAVLEFGRRIAATCGTYVTPVADVKVRRDADGPVHHFAIAEGGIHQITYYGQMMGMKIPPVYVLEQRLGAGAKNGSSPAPAGSQDGPVPAPAAVGQGQAGDAGAMKWSVFGSLCSMNDVLLRDVELGEVHAGDHLVFGRCGAYCPTEGIALFLSRDLPAVFLYDREGGAIKVRDLVPADELNTPRGRS